MTVLDCGNFRQNEEPSSWRVAQEHVQAMATVTSTAPPPPASSCVQKIARRHFERVVAHHGVLGRQEATGKSAEGVPGGVRRAKAQEVRDPGKLLVGAGVQDFDGTGGRGGRVRAGGRASDSLL